MELPVEVSALHVEQQMIIYVQTDPVVRGVSFNN